jgi:cytochrome c oxidase subunit 2
MEKSFQLFPQHASAMSWQVDFLALYLTAVTVFFTVLIFLAILYFGLKYRVRPGHKSIEVAAPMWLEIGWSVIPFGMCLVMFFWGSKLFIDANRPPAGAMEVYIVGKQWMWKIQHPEGRKEINQLHVPMGRPVKLVMASQDVIHDFGLPAFRIKRDVIPGQYSEEWFTADKPGDYWFFCDQYCGAQHAQMIGTVTVMEEKDYQRWLTGAGSDVAMHQAGEKLFVSMNCMSCHGEWAPTMAGLYMSKVKLSDGRTVVADDEYLRRSILDPGADIVAGFESNSTVLMPTFRGTLTEEQIGQIIEYIKSLAGGMNNGQPLNPVPTGGAESEMRKPGVGGPTPQTHDPNEPNE